MMPPSPLLSARMMRITYLTDTTIINDQKIAETPPRTFAVEKGMPWLGLNTSFTAYSGLVPMSPYTTPRAASVSVLRRLRPWLGSCELDTGAVFFIVWLRFKAVADARFGQKVHRPRGIDFERLTQAPNREHHGKRDKILRSL